MNFASLKDDYVFKEVISDEYVRKQFISDVMNIPMEDIREVRIRNSFLRRRRAREKEGILDIALSLNDDTKIDIELQIRPHKEWDKRSLFYLARMYSEDLKSGHDYGRLKKCVSITILDFDLLSGDDNHSVFKLRNEKKMVYSDLLELHVIELCKPLGNGAVDDWIRLFNVKSREELEMMKTENAGIRRAIELMREMSLSGYLREVAEDKEKRRRDRAAEDAYVFDKGVEKGLEQGIEQGIEQGLEQGLKRGHELGALETMTTQICNKLRKGKPIEVISEELETDPEKVRKICEIAKDFAPEYDVKAICDAYCKR
ncbi:MAG: Rpn family recombination-promoting nuclease/putative transposase [Acetatifactor sp.]|nr:Rpn family recombination-promoting nuclease/putative transposase [Acetatifactor sp.]